jgi:23S rRNA (adenine1618-N6)-methyltransferase
MNKTHRGESSSSKSKNLHPRNIHKNGYDFPLLIKSCPRLNQYVDKNTHGNLSIDFANPLAVKALNTALLKHDYGVKGWDIPEGALCPPIPGRVDYIHHISDLLAETIPAQSDTPKRDKNTEVRLLDIGTGANGIYPLLACKTYGWQCVGSDINTQSLENVSNILKHNIDLKNHFELRHQADKNQFFKGIIQPGEFFDVTVCNPPFHASEEDALKGSQRKINNLALNRGDDSPVKNTPLNFGGLEAELWCKGGEALFLKKMVKESKEFATQVRWFTSLVSKVENVKSLVKLMNKSGATDVREIEMAQGNKITRVLAWTFI